MFNLSVLEMGMIGFLAQMVDGMLGMGYGVISSTALIYFGIPPVVASVSVHASELFTTLASCVSHFKFGNIRKDLLWPLISFGVVGGLLGACGLVRMPSKPIQLTVGSILFVMGNLIFYRFLFNHKKVIDSGIRIYSANRLRALGFFAALIDALGGGGWGPICTPTLVVTGTEPNKAVGSVNLAEFFVTLSITFTFGACMGFENFHWDIVIAFLIGGSMAAPLAAYSCKKLPKRLLGTLVGLLVMILSLRILIR